MPMNIGAMRNMNADPRMVQKIKGDQSMMAEQGGPTQFMSEYGGADNYVAFAKMPENDRLVYAAVLDGYTQADQIAVVSGLSQTEVNTSLGKLGREGIVDTGEQFIAKE